MTPAKLAKRIARATLARLGYQIERLDPEHKRYRSPHARGYIRCPETITAAQAHSRSVVEHVEAEWGIAASVRQIVERMSRAGCFERARMICEIGPGTGRYLEKVRRHCPDSRYVIYETDLEWAAWLEREHGVLRREADGLSLRQEPSGSCDLVHAHGVMVYLPLVHAHRYFIEMLRVVAPGGFIVFDFYDAADWDTVMVDECIHGGWDWAVVQAAETIRARFEHAGARLVDDFRIAANLEPTSSRYHIWKAP
jgi:SAM-dependent methyltransferase